MWQFGSACAACGACRALACPWSRATSRSTTRPKGARSTHADGGDGRRGAHLAICRPRTSAARPPPGAARHDRGEFGGSAYLRLLHGVEQGRPPAVDLDARRAWRACCARRSPGHRAHCARLRRGRLAVALAEATIGPAWARPERRSHRATSSRRARRGDRGDPARPARALPRSGGAARRARARGRRERGRPL